MSVVRGMRGVGGVCEMYMCLAWGGVGDEWIRGLDFSFTNPVETGRMLGVCCSGRGGCWSRAWKGGVG